MNPEVNRATFELMGQGKVTSATLLANSPNVEEACARISEFPNCSFGVHLNASEFQPLSKPDKLAPILDDTGSMDLVRFKQANIDKSLAEGIFDEFCAQIDRLITLGVQISHLDSHNYILSTPRLFPLLKKVQRKYRIRKVRISRNIYGDRLPKDLGVPPFVLGLDPDLGYDDIGKVLRVKKWAYNFALKHYFSTKTTDGFSGFRLLYESARSRKLNHATFEVNVHPESSYYDASEEEILRSEWQKDVRISIRLISYLELA